MTKSQVRVKPIYLPGIISKVTNGKKMNYEDNEFSKNHKCNLNIYIYTSFYVLSSYFHVSLSFVPVATA